MPSNHAAPDHSIRGYSGDSNIRTSPASSSKARTIIEAARAVVDGEIDLEGLQRLEDATALERLTRLRGIGRWSAEYVLLRGLGRLHIFPGDDFGAHNKLRHLFGIDTPLDYEAVHRLVARWHPYAGVVYFRLLLDRVTTTTGHSASRAMAVKSAFEPTTSSCGARRVKREAKVVRA